MIASEPAAHESCGSVPDATARIDTETGLFDVERMLMREPGKVRPHHRGHGSYSSRRRDNGC